MIHRRLIEEYEARCRPWSDIQGHLPFLRETAARYKLGMILELGVRTANSTAALLLGAVEAGAHLVSVDITKPTYPEWWHQTEAWSLIVGDDMDPEIQRYTPSFIDVLFIDTSHAYEHTLAELCTYVRRVQPGGVVLLHDVEVERFPELPGSEPPFPVARALDTFCARAGYTWTLRPGSHGLGVIQL